MDENKSLNNKYGKIDEAAYEPEKVEKAEKPKKEKKVKPPKEPKQKKIKEKKVKEKKVSKKTEKSAKEEVASDFDFEENLSEIHPQEETFEEPVIEAGSFEEETVVETTDEVDMSAFGDLGYTFHNDDIQVDDIINDYITENENEDYGKYFYSEAEEIAEEPEIEVPAPVVKKEKVKKAKAEKPKKEKTEKEPKQKKVKEEKVKPEKVKKEKAEKPKKEKKVKPPKEPKPKDKFNKKDFFTILLVAVAVVAVVIFMKYKKAPLTQEQPTAESTTGKAMVSDAVAENDSFPYMSLLESDIPGLFYAISADYQVQYFNYQNGEYVPVLPNGTVKANVLLGKGGIVVPAEIDYIRINNKIFGFGIFYIDEENQDQFDDSFKQIFSHYGMMVFKLTNLPDNFNKLGKALLLMSHEKTEAGVTKALQENDILWHDIYEITMPKEDSNTTPISVTQTYFDNANRDFVVDANGMALPYYRLDHFQVHEDFYKTKASYFPFLTCRNSNVGQVKQDIYIKTDSGEKLFVENVYHGEHSILDGESIIFMRKNGVGFDIYRKDYSKGGVDAEEVLIKQYSRNINEFIFRGEYIFDQRSGKIYNMLTGEEKALLGYKMEVSQFEISPDGKYVVMMGEVSSVMDYQVHIFNLETGEYIKYVDENFSVHSNLAFINETTFIYTALDPRSEHGNTYTIIDISKLEV